MLLINCPSKVSLSTFILTNARHLIYISGHTTKEVRKACLKDSFARELKCARALKNVVSPGKFLLVVTADNQKDVSATPLTNTQKAKR